MLYPLSFTSDIRYLRNKCIEEYDIQSAGYSITISENLIQDEKILANLKISNKYERQIILGLYARDNKEYVKALNEGFRKYITAFITLNDIPSDNILSIKKDSVTIFGGKITRTKFKHAIFTKRAQFTSFLRIGKLEFYINTVTKKRLVKGITLNSYKDTLIEEILTIMQMGEFAKRKVLDARITELRQSYVTRQLADSYYKELSPTGGFLLKNDLYNNTVYSDVPLASDEEFFDVVDISYNYKHILMPFFEVML